MYKLNFYIQLGNEGTIILMTKIPENLGKAYCVFALHHPKLISKCVVKLATTSVSQVAAHTDNPVIQIQQHKQIPINSQLDRKKCQVANSLLIQGLRLGYIERPLALGNYGPTDQKKGQVWNSRNILCNRGNSVLLPVSHRG